MRLDVAAVLITIGLTGAARAWHSAAVDFDIQPGGPGSDQTIASANSPYVFLKHDLVAAALVDTDAGIGFGCLAHPKINSGRCINGTVVYTNADLRNPTAISHVLPVDDESVLFAASSTNESFVAFVSAQHGVLWRIDRRNSTGPVVFDPTSSAVVVSMGPDAINRYDSMLALAVLPGSPSHTIMWKSDLDLSVDPVAGVSSSQFSPTAAIFKGKVWFSYAETLYGVDVAGGPGRNMVSMTAPCGIHSQTSAHHCTMCVHPFHVNVVNPSLGALQHSTASVVVSATERGTGRFRMCGLSVYAGTNATTVRFNTTDASTIEVLAPFTFTTDAASTHGTRRHTAFFVSARVTGGTNILSTPTLLAFNAADGTLLWADSRSAKDVYSLPVELQPTHDTGGDSVAYQRIGQLVAKKVDTQEQVWFTDATQCSQTATTTFDPTRIYCVNDTYGVAAVSPPTEEQSTSPVINWGVMLPTRGREPNAGAMVFRGYGGEQLLGVGLQFGRFAAVVASVPATTSPAPTSPAPTGTGTPKPKPVPPSPTPSHTSAPGSPPDDGKLSPGIVVLIVFVTIAVLAMGAGLVFRQWKLRRHRRRGAIDSALSYGGDGNAISHSTQHASVAAHGPQSGYGSLYV